MTLFLISACCCLLPDIYCSTFIQCLWFDSVFIQCNAYCLTHFFCSVFVLYGKCSVLFLEMPSRYIDPVNIEHQAVTKYHTPDSAIFSLSIGVSGLLRPWT
jgi:hypothetical protein